MAEVSAASRGRKSLAAAVQRLAQFRYELRRFLRFSEQAARAEGLTPQQHQLLLGVAGFTGRRRATISELAEFLQERHDAVVGLVQRAERRGLVQKIIRSGDHRFVQVRLTVKGQRLLNKLTRAHLAHLGNRHGPRWVDLGLGRSSDERSKSA